MNRNDVDELFDETGHTTVDGAAKILGLNRKAINTLLDAGEIKASCFGIASGFTKEDLLSVKAPNEEGELESLASEILVGRVMTGFFRKLARRSLCSGVPMGELFDRALHIGGLELLKRAEEHEQEKTNTDVETTGAGSTPKGASQS